MLKAMKLDEVWYMVSPQNPWKREADDLKPEQVRYEITEAALEGEEGLIASDYEFHLPRPSYTWNTLQNLKADFPDHRFTLIIGGDNWERFPNWAHAGEILQNYQIAVFPRASTNEMPDGLYPQDRQPGHKQPVIISVPLVNITSTDIRRMLREGQDATPFIPEKAIDLILRHYSTATP